MKTDYDLDPDPQVAFLGQQILDWIRVIRYAKKSGCHRLELHAKDGDIHSVNKWESQVIEMPTAIRGRK